MSGFNLTTVSSISRGLTGNEIRNTRSAGVTIHSCYSLKGA